MDKSEVPVLLIDLSAIFRACWHANPDGPTSVAFQGTLDGVARCMGMVPGALVGVCCDARGNWRKELSPEYKAHREKQPEAMYGLLDRVKERLRKDGHVLWAVDGYEADDLIAGATKTARAAGHDVVIASHDKDLLQLVDEHVRCLRTSTWTIVGTAEVVAKFGIEPEGVADFLSLTGDKGDNIQGVPSVGPVTAAALLIRHGGLDGIYRKIDALQVFDKNGTPQVVTMTPDAKAIATPAIVDKLWRFKASAMLARKLVALRTDAPIKFDAIYARREPQSLQEDTVANIDDVIDPPPPRLASVPIETTPMPAQATQEKQRAAPDVQPAETAMVVASGVTYERALEPMSSTAALKLGGVLYDSRLYSRFPSAAAITAVIMQGREMGLGAMTALNAFHVVEGRPCPHAYLIIARAKSDPDCEYFQLIEQSPTSATWETKNRRNPKVTRMSYSLEEARAAGLAKPGSNWDKRPTEMVVKTAGVKLARVEYPASAMNLYAVEEMEAA